MMQMARSLLLVILFCFASSLAVGQPGDPTDGNPTVPISGIEILIAIGGAVGIKKLLGKDKKTP